MSTIRKREWETPSGEPRSAWLVAYKDGAGKRRFKQFAKKRDAEDWLTKAAWEVSQGTHTADAASITVAEACQLWLDKSETEDLEATTIAGYEQRVRLHIRPLIGSEKLSKLTRPLVETFRDLLVQSRGKAMAAMVMRALSSAIGEAQRRGLVAQNVASGVRVRRPKREREPVIVPTKDDLRAILKNADDRERPLMMTAIFTGLRASELRGLRWADVNFENPIVTVSQRADRFGEIGAPKSAAARRSIPLPPGLVAELKRWKLACPNGNLDLVFPTRRGTVQMLTNMRRRLLIPCLKKAGACDTADGEDGPIIKPRYGFHSFRHAAASLWIERGVDPKRIQTWLGHASIQLTFDTYGHLFAEAQSDAEIAARIEKDLAV